jgi:dTMP kinase
VVDGARGRFIAFEGIDGSGKSTQAHLLAATLRNRGISVRETREPGGTPLGERIRELLLGEGHGAVADATEVYLFAAARAQLVAEVIRPALARGEWVVCDRFLDSSLAYQGAGRGLGIEAVLAANALALDDCLPDVTVVIDVPLATACVRRGVGDRIESAADGFHARVADGYRRLVAMYPQRIRAVRGAGTPPEVHARVLAVVEELV